MCRHADATPDNIALRGATDQWTCLQLRDASMRYAGALAAAGPSPGGRVLLAAPVPEFVVAYLGIQAAACVVVPVNTMSTRLRSSTFSAMPDAHWRSHGTSSAPPSRRRPRRSRCLSGAVPECAGHRCPCRRCRPGPRRDRGHPVHVGHQGAAEGRPTHRREPVVRRGDRRRAQPCLERRPHRHRTSAVPRVRPDLGHDGDPDRGWHESGCPPTRSRASSGSSTRCPRARPGRSSSGPSTVRP